MARIKPSCQSHRPQQWSFCLVLVISVLVFTTRTIVSSVSTDHSDLETNDLNIISKDSTRFAKVNSFANLFKGTANLAVKSTKYTTLNKRKRRSSDSEAFPFEAPETCSLTETELDQIIGLIQKFGAVDKNFCKKLPAGTSTTSSTKSVNNSTKIASPKKSTTNVSQTKSGANTTKPIISHTKSVVTSTKLSASPKNSITNSTASFLEEIKSDQLDASVRRKRSLPTEGCNQLIESIKLSTNNVKSTFCDLSITKGTTDPLYEERKAAYETEITQLKEKLDNKDLQVEQKYKAKIDKLKKDFQKVEKNMRDTLIKLETEQFSHMKTNAELVLPSS